MRPFFVIRQIFANAVDHHHDESAIIHVQPIGAADDLIGAVSGEGTVNIFAKVGLVKPCMMLDPAFRLLGAISA